MSVTYGSLLWAGWYVDQIKLADMYEHTKEYQIRLENGEDKNWLEEEYDNWVYDYQYEHIQILNYYGDSDYAVGIFLDPDGKTIFEFAEELTECFRGLTEWWRKTFVLNYPMPRDFGLHIDTQTN